MHILYLCFYTFQLIAIQQLFVSSFPCHLEGFRVNPAHNVSINLVLSFSYFYDSDLPRDYNEEKNLNTARAIFYENIIIKKLK